MHVCQLLGAGLLGAGGQAHRADLAGDRGSWAGMAPMLEGEPVTTLRHPRARVRGMDGAGGWEWRPPEAAALLCCGHKESQRSQTSAHLRSWNSGFD